STNVSLMLTGVPPIVFVTVTVIVVVPFRSATGVSVSVRVDGVSGPTTTFPFGKSVVLLDVAVIESNGVDASPTVKVNGGSGVSSAVALSLMSSIDGSASNAPMSTVAVVSASAASRMRATPVPRRSLTGTVIRNGGA